MCAPARAFDLFWELQHPLRIANATVASASLGTSVTVAALNAQRDPAAQREDWGQLTARIASVSSAKMWEEVDGIVAHTASQVSMRPLCSALGRHVAETHIDECVDAVERWQYHIKVRDDLAGAGLALALRGSKWWNWPGIFWRGVNLDRDDLVARGYRVGYWRGAVAITRVKRLCIGLRKFSRMVHLLRR
jgi:hypothetical protein